MCLPMWRAEDAGVEVVAAAGREADRERDVLALVEIRDALRVGGRAIAASDKREGVHSNEMALRMELAAHIGGKMCGNFARSLPRRSSPTSTTVGNVPLSFMS